MPTQSVDELRTRARDMVAAIVGGDKIAAARAITGLENESPLAPYLQSAIYPHTGRAYRVGITGPPGAGKSTLLDRLAVAARKRDLKIGILSIDPSSPFTRGALLGDRVRMADATADPGVFMRSMASRGALGGLARTTLAAADVIDALGQDLILIETVGVGQSELEVSKAADATVVVLTPESGGGVQTIKAGLMEIADLLVINKADRPGADTMEMELLDYLDIVEQGRLMHGRATFRPNGKSLPGEPWAVPVLQTSATEGKGVEELLDSLLAYRKWLDDSGAWNERRLRQARAKLREMVTARVERALWDPPEHTKLLDSLAERLIKGKMEPREAVERFLTKVRSDGLSI
jgi:LAO/AO transport system kinase